MFDRPASELLLHFHWRVRILTLNLYVCYHLKVRVETNWGWFGSRVLTCTPALFAYHLIIGLVVVANLLLNLTPSHHHHHRVRIWDLTKLPCRLTYICYPQLYSELESTMQNA